VGGFGPSIFTGGSPAAFDRVLSVSPGITMDGAGLKGIECLFLGWYLKQSSVTPTGSRVALVPMMVSSLGGGTQRERCHQDPWG